MVRNNTWKPTWDDLLVGANKLTVHVTATVTTDDGVEKSVSASKGGYQIHGENPWQPQIFLIANFVEAKAVGWKESEHRQFENPTPNSLTKPYSGVGLPSFGTPNGWGLMQLDNPPASEEQIWSWKANVKKGVSYLMDIHAIADQYFRMHHNESWAWHPDTHPDKVWDDVFSRYNTGSPMYSPDGNDGMPHCSGESEFANPDGANTAERFARM